MLIVSCWWIGVDRWRGPVLRPWGDEVMMNWTCWPWCVVALIVTLTAPMRAAADKPGDEARDEALRFFETKIRPVLVEQCYECHSTKADAAGMLRGGLRLDTRAAMRRGGDSGPAVVPGRVEDSLLISAVRRESFEMPPDGALPAHVVADFVKWVKTGALDPREDAAGPAIAAKPSSDRVDHWAFRPVRRPALPAVKQTEWIRTPIDAFILARLEAAGLSPSPEAVRRTLIRRLSYDLIGLPPTPQEVEDFLADDRLDAYARLVDRLLASPHYGERWGRHWLDVARYADTKDLVLLYGKDRIRAYAYTYRDYVIRAFNENLPYDDFIRHQLAADRMADRVEPWQLAAMGFLTLGRLFDNNPPDVYDDQIDTVTRGLLGLTVACARCHDHKYDPIPTADYYSLYGIFANSMRPVEKPLTADPRDIPGAEEFEKQVAPKREELRKFIDDHARKVATTAYNRIGDYLAHVATTKPDPVTENAVFFMSLSPDDLKPQFISAWRRFLDRRASDDDPVFGPWDELMRLSPQQLAAEAPAVARRWRQRPAGVERGQLNPLVAEMLSEHAASFRTREDVARAYGDLLRTAFDRLQETPDDAADDGLRAAREQLTQVLSGRASPFFFPKSHTYLYLSRVPRSQYGAKLLELDKLAVYSPSAPPRAMVLVDSEVITEPRVFIRGNPNRPGEIVPRRFLEVIAGADREPFTDGSGRLELAEAIVDPDNPLTARVFVNRVWQHHFGRPIVGTPSDFGLRSDPPTHPKLLDWLAAEFVESGWDIKHLHRLMVLSAAYRQSSSAECGVRNAELAESTSQASGTPHSAFRTPHLVDPDNRLLWRMNRRRLGLEAMRDGLLAVSGRLDRRLYGRPTDLAHDPLDARRTVYGLVDRQDLPGLYRVFDFASPDQSAAMRPETTTPQQALFGLNSEFVWQQATALAERSRSEKQSDDARIDRLHRLVFQRPARPENLSAAHRFLAAVKEQPNGGDPWTVYAQVLLLTNEATFID